MSKKKQISVIGGGPAAILFACFIDTSKYDVHLYEQNKSLGRKFLVAGKGGFNLTHSEPVSQMLNRYTPNNFLEQALLNFTNDDLRDWLNQIGVPTKIGSSKRVYPLDNIKPIEVLKAIETQIKNNGVHLYFEHKWMGWADNQLLFENQVKKEADIVVFGLGGGSWKVTGSYGDWLDLFKKKGVDVKPFQPSNCAYKVEWSDDVLKKVEGQPLKNITIKCIDKTVRGEVVLTHFGIEGNAIYALSPQIRNLLQANKKAEISIDFKPMFSHQQLTQKYNNSNQKNIAKILKNDLKLSQVQIDLLKAYLSKDKYTHSRCLIKAIKSFKLTIVGTEVLGKAISTVGGIALKSIDENYQLKQLPNHYCIGEMLDWDAPTGGYLLQACFSMGMYLADNLNQN